MARIKEDLSVSLDKTACSLHAYVLMTNHMHLLVTPEEEGELGKFMQSLANRYVRYFNAGRHRTGTIWEGRFKSCLVDSDEYLLGVYRYIEMNPVRAGMVDSASAYRWSSYPRNGLGEEDGLITEHEVYSGLGSTPAQRCQRYQKLLEQPITQKESDEIARATLKGEVYGGEDFHRRMGKLLSRPTRLSPHGGDRKSEAYRNQAG